LFREISRRGGEGDDCLYHLHHMEYRLSKIASVITFEDDELLSEKRRASQVQKKLLDYGKTMLKNEVGRISQSQLILH
jgi:hypothetical protein